MIIDTFGVREVLIPKPRSNETATGASKLEFIGARDEMIEFLINIGREYTKFLAKFLFADP
jgi:hypothetical protein